jgi:hypothetical protein
VTTATANRPLPSWLPHVGVLSTVLMLMLGAWGFLRSEAKAAASAGLERASAVAADLEAHKRATATAMERLELRGLDQQQETRAIYQYLLTKERQPLLEAPPRPIVRDGR